MRGHLSVTREAAFIGYQLLLKVILPDVHIVHVPSVQYARVDAHVD